MRLFLHLSKRYHEAFFLHLTTTCNFSIYSLHPVIQDIRAILKHSKVENKRHMYSLKAHHLLAIIKVVSKIKQGGSNRKGKYASKS
jgi:hypothetical protein